MSEEQTNPSPAPKLAAGKLPAGAPIARRSLVTAGAPPLAGGPKLASPATMGEEVVKPKFFTPMLAAQMQQEQEQAAAEAEARYKEELQAYNDQVAAEAKYQEELRVYNEQLAAQQAEADRIAAEQGEQARVEAERVAAEQAEQARVEAERVATEQAAQAAAQQAEIQQMAAAQQAELAQQPDTAPAMEQGVAHLQQAQSALENMQPTPEETPIPTPAPVLMGAIPMPTAGYIAPPPTAQEQYAYEPPPVPAEQAFQDHFTQEDLDARRAKVKRMWIILSIVALLVCGLGGWAYYNKMENDRIILENKRLEGFKREGLKLGSNVVLRAEDAEAKAGVKLSNKPEDLDFLMSKIRGAEKATTASGRDWKGAAHYAALMSQKSKPMALRFINDILKNPDYYTLSQLDIIITIIAQTTNQEVKDIMATLWLKFEGQAERQSTMLKRSMNSMSVAQLDDLLRVLSKPGVNANLRSSALIAARRVIDKAPDKLAVTAKVTKILEATPKDKQTPIIGLLARSGDKDTLNQLIARIKENPDGSIGVIYALRDWSTDDAFAPLLEIYKDAAIESQRIKDELKASLLTIIAQYDRPRTNETGTAMLAPFLESRDPKDRAYMVSALRNQGNFQYVLDALERIKKEAEEDEGKETNSDVKRAIGKLIRDAEDAHARCRKAVHIKKDTSKQKPEEKEESAEDLIKGEPKK